MDELELELSYEGDDKEYDGVEVDYGESDGEEPAAAESPREEIPAFDEPGAQKKQASPGKSDRKVTIE